MIQKGGGGHEIVSGGMDGWVTVQDIRKASDENDASSRKVQNTGEVTCMKMHPKIGLLATAGCREFIQVSRRRRPCISLLMMMGYLVYGAF